MDFKILVKPQFYEFLVSKNPIVTKFKICSWRILKSVKSYKIWHFKILMKILHENFHKKSFGLLDL